MNQVKLNVCSNGDPENPKTWSGTPFYIYSELLKNENLGNTLDFCGSINKYILFLTNQFSRIYYCKSDDINFGFFNRLLFSSRVISMAKRSYSNHTLHFGSLGLPFYSTPKSQNHYLFCDSTWHLWSTNSHLTRNYSKRLLLDANKIANVAYHKMEHIFSTSEYVKSDLIDYYKIPAEKITVVGTGLGIIKPFFGEKNYNNNKVLFVAKERFEDKGGLQVIEAFRIIHQRNRAISLIIVGQDEYKKRINFPNIKTFGFVSLENLQNLFNEASLFLMPAINEPWGYVYLEAMACKMPIVGINKNSFPELSKNGRFGFGLESSNPEELADLIINAMFDTKKLDQMGIEAQNYVLNNFSWESTVSTIINKISGKTK